MKLVIVIDRMRPFACILRSTEANACMEGCCGGGEECRKRSQEMRAVDIESRVELSSVELRCRASSKLEEQSEKKEMR